MDLISDDFIQLYAKLYACANSEGIEQLDVYPQIQFLYNYFDNCVFEDNHLEEGKTYILPMDTVIGLFDESDYSYYTNPDKEEYDPDLISFIESHNNHIEDGCVCVTLKAGTQFIYSRSFTQGPHGIELIIDGYPIEWYDTLIGKGRFGNEGLLPFVIKA